MVLIGEHLEVESVFFDRSSSGIRSLRGEGDEGGSQTGDFLVFLRQRGEGDIAIGAPTASIPGHDDRTSLQKIGKFHEISLVVLQAEIRGFLADFQHAVINSGCLQLLQSLVLAGEQCRRGFLSESIFPGIQLLLQAICQQRLQ